MQPTFFPTPADFHAWLKANHNKEAELLVGFYKTGSGRPSITWPESVTEALIYGWIDGVRRAVDTDSYSIRFTPRKPTSIWSAVNIAKADELIATGRMQPAGLAAYQKRTEQKSKIYAYEKEPEVFTGSYEAAFKKEEAAWAFFTAQAPSYQRSATHWVLGAKQEATRDSRFHTLLTDCAAGRRLKQYSYGKSGGKK